MEGGGELNNKNDGYHSFQDNLSFPLLPENLRLILHTVPIFSFFVWVSNWVSYIKGPIQEEWFPEIVAEEYILG